MATITTRSGKGSPLTNNEVDANFTNLNTDKAELSGATFTGQIVAPSLDISGDIDVDGTTNLDVVDIDGATHISGAITSTETIRQTNNANSSSHNILVSTTNKDSTLMAYGVDRNGTVTGIKVDGSLVAPSLDISGDIDVDGTTNLDVVDIDGAVDMASTLTVTGEITANGGIDVTGSISADGLTVDGDVLLNGDRNLHLVASNPNAGTSFQYGEITLGDAATSQYANHAKIIANGNYANQSNLEFHTSNNNSSPLRMKIHEIGDISFYEDTGTTAKFFWDASAERLGIGTSSPLDALHIVSAVSSDYRGNLFLDDSTTGFAAGVGGQITFGAEYRSNGEHTEWAAIQGAKANSTDANYAGTLEFKTRANGGALQTKMVLDDSGNVGIGESSPHSFGANQSGLTISDGTGGCIRLKNDANSVNFDIENNGGNGINLNSVNAFPLAFSTSNTERMRIDSSGKVSFGPDALDMQIDPASTNSGINLLYMRGNALGDKAEISLNHYGHHNYHIGSGLVGDGKFSIGTSQTDNSFVMDSSGNVGIGTGNPTGKLEVFNSGNSQMRLSTSASGALKLEQNTNGAFIGTTSTGASAGVLRLGTGDAERLRIDSSGNVGIGTSSPTNVSGYTTLNVGAGTIGSIIKIDGAGSGHYHRILNNNGQLYIQADQGNTTGSSAIVFGVDATERMRIDSSGNLLVATTDSNVSNNNGSGTGFNFLASGQQKIATDDDLSLILNRLNGDGGVLEFKKDGLSVGSISVTGSATSYNTSSDYRLKEDWQPVENATDRLKELKPCNFAWKVDGSRVDGFLAHELQEVVPEAVTGEKDAMQTEKYEVTPAVYEDVVIPATEEVLDEEGNVITEAQEERTEQQLVSEAVMGEREVPDYQAIDQSKLVPLLVATIQELEARISALEA